jgi:hypothetical protein
MLDPLFKTGFARLAVSLPSLAIASAILYNMIRIQTKISYIAIAGTLLFFKPEYNVSEDNSNDGGTIYAFFVAADYYFQKSLKSSEFFSHNF